ncbi:MAG: carbon-nitrogen hydrolase family protein [Anaerolineae bacterium]|nr:carbon-nitrogen hydrolase family protein [Anaerolineae bacterium]MDW8070113.1 carbon-nitrogen hydrolase family protein [Anaerolineae bacterium]
MRVAVVQMRVAGERDANLARALQLIEQAARRGAELVVLPEYVTFLGALERFAEAAETVPGPTTEALAACARQYGIYLHTGSLIERSPVNGRFYNTSCVLDPQGALIAVYRKVHLFDATLSGSLNERESQVILPGDALCLAQLPELVLGLSICFDLRFPEMYRRMALAGAEAFAVPAAFMRVTGRAQHWEILLRARAIENHAYVLAAGQCGRDAAGRPHYGNSMIIGPWGEILAAAPEEGECVLIARVERTLVQRRRKEIPVLQLQRPEVYATL